MEPRWARKLDTEAREPSPAPFANSASAGVHTRGLGLGAIIGIAAGQAGGGLLQRLTVQPLFAMTGAVLVTAGLAWAGWALAKRRSYMTLGIGVVFVVAFLGSIVLKLLLALKP